MPGVRNSKPEDRFIVYKHTNIINNKSYIGITKRTLEERVHDGYGGSVKFNNAINKYGWGNFTSTILEENLSLSDACKKEQYYIQKYNSIENGYNLSEGGLYGTHSDESIKKMSERMRGNTFSRNYVWTKEAKNNVSEGLKKFYGDPIKSAYVRKRQSEANKGKVVSEETRKKTSEKLKGRTFSKETIEKMRQAALNRTKEHQEKINKALRERRENK